MRVEPAHRVPGCRLIGSLDDIVVVWLSQVRSPYDIVGLAYIVGRSPGCDLLGANLYSGTQTCWLNALRPLNTTHDNYLRSAPATVRVIKLS